ncbi:regulator of chromosome condensation rcc1 [Cyclospora cayetanensis]|uniref:Regulator of chromosome condensation rcc1 n=1 Tax=Cyclospora cayetanensis TaxID=88456 RepID=A0A1D3D5R0_9EIME|nr:regulator of chromosome condensation rcc1 [Cyclospora cayetanensis]
MLQVALLQQEVDHARKDPLTPCTIASISPVASAVVEDCIEAASTAVAVAAPCEAARQAVTSADAPANAVAAPASGPWKCSVCLVSNEATCDVCPCCETGRDGSRQVPKASPALSSGSGGSSVFLEGLFEGETKNGIPRKSAGFTPVLDSAATAACVFSLQSPLSAVYMMGSGELEQIPFFTPEEEGGGEVMQPRLIPLQAQMQVVGAASGALHTVLLLASGACCSFGCNDEGALGRLCKDTPANEPGLVELPDAAVSVACGDSHSAFVTAQGRLLLCGSYRDASGALGFARLGKGSRVMRQLLPVDVFASLSLPIQIAAVACGEDHTVALERGGEAIWLWGSNDFGQLAVGSAGASASAAAAAVLDANSGAAAAAAKAAEVAASDAAQEEKQRLLEPTRRPLESLGLSDEMQAITAVYCGRCTTFIAASPKAAAGATPEASETFLFACGRNTQGELGLWLSEQQAPPGEQAVVCEFKRVQLLQEGILKNVCGGQFFTLVLTAGGKIYTFGQENFLGRGSTACVPSGNPRLLPLCDGELGIRFRWIGCGSDHALAVSRSGCLYTWGAGQNYQLGTGDDPVLLPSPARIDPQNFKNQCVLQVFDGGGDGRRGKSFFPCLSWNKKGEGGITVLTVELFRVAMLLLMRQACGGAQHSTVLAWSGSYAEVLQQQERQPTAEQAVAAAAEEERKEGDQQLKRPLEEAAATTAAKEASPPPKKAKHGEDSALLQLHAQTRSQRRSRSRSRSVCRAPSASVASEETRAKEGDNLNVKSIEKDEQQHVQAEGHMDSETAEPIAAAVEPGAPADETAGAVAKGAAADAASMAAAAAAIETVEGQADAEEKSEASALAHKEARQRHPAAAKKQQQRRESVVEKGKVEGDLRNEEQSDDVASAAKSKASGSAARTRTVEAATSRRGRSAQGAAASVAAGRKGSSVTSSGKMSSAAAKAKAKGKPAAAPKKPATTRKAISKPVHSSRGRSKASTKGKAAQSKPAAAAASVGKKKNAAPAAAKKSASRRGAGSNTKAPAAAKAGADKKAQPQQQRASPKRAPAAKATGERGDTHKQGVTSSASTAAKSSCGKAGRSKRAAA